MIRTKYSKEFERLWNAFDSDFGQKGSKKKAYEVFRKMRIDSEDVDYIIGKLNAQIAAKQEIIESGDWAEPFQHVERYLRNERFEDEISRPISRESYEERERRLAREFIDNAI